MQYLRARYYDSGIGGFITQDTYRGDIINPLTLNLYTYTGNSPLNLIDPSGHGWWDSVKSWGNDRINDVKNVANYVGNWVGDRVDDVKNVANSVGNWIGDRANDVKSTFNNAINWVGNKAIELKNTVVQFGKNAIAEIKETGQKIAKLTGDAYAWGKEQARQLLNTGSEYLSYAKSRCSEAMEEARHKICTTANRISTAVSDWASNVDLERTLAGIAETAGGIIGTVGGVCAIVVGAGVITVSAPAWLIAGGIGAIGVGAFSLFSGSSNIIAGTQDTLYGISGDSTTKTLNPGLWSAEQIGMSSEDYYLLSALSTIGSYTVTDNVAQNQAYYDAVKSGASTQKAIESGSNTNPNALRYNGDGSYTSNKGLVYGQGSKDGNRVKHVLQHTVPNDSKPLHTVYNVDKSEVIGLIDEAWVNKGQGILQSNGNVLYDINMGKIIGTNGEDTIRIITKGYSNNIITAFPLGKGVN